MIGSRTLVRGSHASGGGAPLTEYQRSARSWDERAPAFARRALRSSVPSTGGHAALHGAVNTRLQECDFGPAVERPQRGFEKLGAEPGRADIFHRRAFGLVPGHVEPAIGQGP